jgi:cbb3-type cytochrome oxidase maturation protein
VQILFLLIGASLIVAGGFVGAFLWALRNGQFDDSTTPAMRMLNDDTTPGCVEPAIKSTKPENQTTKTVYHEN